MLRIDLKKGMMMNRTSARSSLWASLAVLATLGACTKKQEPTVAKATTVSILHQSNRLGELEPCGCDSNPYGGLDREKNAVDQIRKQNPVLYVDAGNLFLAETKRPVTYYQEKAGTLASILDTIGLDAYSPGEKDFLLGDKYLKELSSKTKFKWVSSNITDAKGNLLFAPYTVVERGGVKFAITGVMNPSAKLAGLKIGGISEALKKVVPEMRAKSDFVVLLSELGVDENEKLARTEDVNILIGADSGYSSDHAQWYQQGKVLMVDATSLGHRLGKLDIELAIPFKGFSSPQAVQANLEDIYLSKQLLAKKPKDKGLQNYISLLEKNRPMEVIAGGTSYQHELLKLDKERFGEPNAVTQLLAQEKERIRQKALGE